MDDEDSEKIRKVFSAIHTPSDAFLLVRQLLHMLFIAFAGPLIPRGILHTYPNEPMAFYTIWGTARLAGLSVKRGIGPPARARASTRTMLFADQTLIDERELPPEHVDWLNGRCLDISKSTVARLSEQVFGTSLLVDPASFSGTAVRKSEVNGMHDAEIIECPRPREDGYVYQRLINNATNDGTEVEDLRAVIVGAQMPFVYRKRRMQGDRFLNVNTSVVIEKPEAVFSHAELRRIFDYAERIGMDFGEFDVLRDRQTGSLHIVDANRTSISPPIALPYSVRLKCLKMMAKAFKKEFMGARAAKRLKERTLTDFNKLRRA